MAFHLHLIIVLLAASLALSFPENHNRSKRSISVNVVPDEWPGEEGSARPTYDEYEQIREKFIQNEFDQSLGSDIILNAKELQANDIIMAVKWKEYNSGFFDPHQFLASRHFFEVYEKIKDTDMFKILKKMPKGAILHSHDIALTSANFMVTITDRENLWQCPYSTSNLPIYKFSRTKPNPKVNCGEYVLVADEKLRVGAENYDTELRKLFTLYVDDPADAYRDVNAVWAQFMRIFTVVEPLVTYEPVWKDYFKQALSEIYEDATLYLEFRGSLPKVYDLDGNVFSAVEIVQMYKDVSDQFVQDNPGFIGSKFIYAPLKFVTDDTINMYMDTITTLSQTFPDYIAGFDLVGQEDVALPINGFVEQMLTLPQNINFFLHAGETNWYGTSSDENMIDAVLMGTKRIGDGYAIVKHPMLMELIKERDIAIEINPISNQVLKLVDDIRNHPAAILIAENVPMVISSDDPGYWEATPLTDDFYVTFMGIASKLHDLRLIKKLAMNSLQYSGMSTSERTAAFIKWQEHWDTFIDDVINNHLN